MTQNSSISSGGASAASLHQTYVEAYSHTPKEGEPYAFRLNVPAVNDLSFVLEGAEDLPEFYSVDDEKARAYLDSLDPLEAMCRAVVASRSSLFSPSNNNPATPGININIDMGKAYRNGDTGRLMWPSVDKDVIFFDLPGHGKQGRCGIVRDSDNRPELVGCTAEECCHYARLKRWFCGRPQCLDWHCLRSYCLDKGEEAADRLKAADILLNDAKVRIQHIVISWDPESDLSWMSSRKRFNYELQKAYRLLLEAGMLGGMAVFHAESWEGDQDGSGSDYSKRFPADALKNGLGWHLRPHIHAVGPAWLEPEKVREIYERTGFVIKSIASKNSEGKRLDREDVRGIVAYCLSHAGLGFPLCGEGKSVRVLRSFGICSSRAKVGIVKVAELAEADPVCCPVCARVSDDSSVPLYDLRSYIEHRFSPDPPEPITKRHPYGVYCTRAYVGWVRDSIDGLSPPEVVSFARENLSFVYTECRVPVLPKPKGLRLFEASSRVPSDAEWREAVRKRFEELGLDTGGL